MKGSAHAYLLRSVSLLWWGCSSLRYYYGLVLDHAKQYTEAEAQYRQAIDINPRYTPPYVQLGRLLESNDLGSAVASYDTFLMRSPQSDTTRAWVTNRLKSLVGTP